MSEAAEKLAEKLADGLLKNLTVSVNPDALRETVAKRLQEPTPYGHEHFEHLREEGA